MRVGSDTFSKLLIQKVLLKLTILPNYRQPLHSFLAWLEITMSRPGQKIGMILEKKGVENSSY